MKFLSVIEKSAKPRCAGYLLLLVLMVSNIFHLQPMGGSIRVVGRGNKKRKKL